MSRCEHGELISLFCINEKCTWREAGGCKLCIKKYHEHAQSFDILGLDKLEEQNKLFYVRPEIKPKSEVLQEAVYNYFIIMKSQINASLDAVSRAITAKLSHPYLCSESFINVFKKIKNKEYKKIDRKELRKFSQFMNVQNIERVEVNEKKLYKEEVAQLLHDIKNINEIFLKYSKAVDKLDNSFDVEKSFLSKIIEISEIITDIKGQQEVIKDKSSSQDYLLSGTSSQKVKESKDGNESLPKDMHHHNESKDKSYLYKTGNNQSQKTEDLKAHESFSKNEKEIYERKKKLFDMLNKPEETVFETNPLKSSFEGSKNSFGPEEKNQYSILATPNKTDEKINPNKKFPEEKILPNIENENEKRSKKKYKRQESLESEKIEIVQKINEKEQKETQEHQNIQLFGELMIHGMNISEMIAHTILPRVESKPKLYEDTREVKETKITIPVKKFDKEEESFSPLLKRKRENKENHHSPISENNPKDKEMEEIIFFDKENNIKTENNQHESTMLMKDQEANSLALLIESLPLEANKAIHLLEAALKYARNNLSAAEYLSYLYLETMKPKQCLELCNSILEQVKESPEVKELSIHIKNNKAAALNQLGRYSESIGILEECLNFTKRDISYKNLGDSYFSISIYEKAILNYEKAIEMNDQMDEAYYNLAVAYYIQKHHNEAKLNVEKAIELNPHNEDYLLLKRQLNIKLHT